MESVFIEMKDSEDMRGSLNSKVSLANRLKRPVSLSESFAHSQENILRFEEYEQEQEQEQEQQSPPTDNLQVNNEVFLYSISTIIRFVFHIALISVFETLFIFVYVSTLEDSGIEKTVGGFVTSIVDSCQNFTANESAVATDILSLFINATSTIDQGQQAYQSRRIVNGKLLIRAWIYVGCFGSIFVILGLVVLLLKLRIQWKVLLLENIGMVCLLAAYEYMFFSTIIYPYVPTTADEISQNAIEDLQQSCGLFK